MDTRSNKSILTVSDIQAKLHEAFGCNPFKPSELKKHFTDEELVTLTNHVILDLRNRGHLIVVVLESGQEAFQLV